MGFATPWVLWLLPLAVLPLLLERTHSRTYSWVAMLPDDPLSNFIGLLLKILAALALFTIILGLAGPHSLEQQAERIGVGAQIALVLDRSASMDDPFSGGGSDGRVGETKSVAASRLMTEFVNQRQNDMIGIITFSNSAMYVLPLTENREAVWGQLKPPRAIHCFKPILVAVSPAQLAYLKKCLTLARAPSFCCRMVAVA